MVSVVTIPETAYNASSYVDVRRRSRLLSYFIKLSNRAALTAIGAYLVGWFVIKRLLETKNERTLGLTTHLRAALRDGYLKMIGYVEHIPIVTMNKNGSLCADAVIQTDDSYLDRKHQVAKEQRHESTKSLVALKNKLTMLSDTLDKQCQSYLVSEMPLYVIADIAVKNLRKKADSTYFAYDTVFTKPAPDVSAVSNEPKRPINLVSETKLSIRSIKGMYMSGMA
ncbi:uncharacterized protein KQ657_002990 [Scheffersomyces spartinae]|uniref:Uncharacterized protein n=1 Tax=Scheffersomyces spartinae TaxID=45513 RepID=A0A9P7V5L7_9ASCO|nr:uncharacterized protein KQ657_002990 [Scheffersomyces spartinae]KAG7191595.1 hypothetical protein KQ657_002990 [Scheffersomyces spartinae]